MKCYEDSNVEGIILNINDCFHFKMCNGVYLINLTLSCLISLVGMLLVLEREIIQEKRLRQLLSYGLHSPDTQTRQGMFSASELLGFFL